MIVNYQTDKTGRLTSVTAYPLDESAPTIEIEDIDTISDYVLRDGSLALDPLPPSAAEQIAELKAKLAATDYAVIKIAEGAATAEEYAEIIAQRQQWRSEINELENAENE